MKFADYAAQQGYYYETWQNVDDDTFKAVVEDLYLDMVRRDYAQEKAGFNGILDVFVVQGNKLNAMAGIFEDGDVITIYSGVLQILRSVCRALVVNGVFSKNSSFLVSGKELQSPYEVQDILDDPSLFVIDELSDPVDEDMAKGLYYIAARFLLAHEYAHLVNGHVAWLKESIGMNLIDELIGEKFKLQDYNRETLEWDADCSAIQACLERSLSPIIEVSSGRATWKLPPNNRFGNELHGLIAAIAGASCVALLMCAISNRDPFDLTPSSHPHPMLRMSNIVQAAWHQLAFRTGSPSQTFEDDALDALGRVFGAWLFLFPKFGALQGTVMGYSDTALANTKRLEIYTRVWEDLYPSLNRLKRIDKLAPATPQTHPAYPSSDVRG